MKNIIFFVLPIILLTGCAYPNMTTPPSQITGAYVSSMKYEAFDCARLDAEMSSLARRENQLVIAQEQRLKVSEQQAFWKGYGQGDGIEASELATVRGEKEAVRTAFEVKRCTMPTSQPSTTFTVPYTPAAK